MKFTMKWGSHIPILLKIMSITNGDVLELGMGLYSTPLLFWMCIDTKRKLTSYENDPKYFRLLGRNNNKFHESYLIQDWNKINIDKNWDMAFIDTNPMIVRAELAE